MRALSRDVVRMPAIDDFGLPGMNVVTTTLCPWAQLTTSVQDGRRTGETVLWIDGTADTADVSIWLREHLSMVEHDSAANAISDLMERKCLTGSQPDWLLLTEADVRYATATVLA